MADGGLSAPAVAGSLDLSFLLSNFPVSGRDLLHYGCGAEQRHEFGALDLTMQLTRALALLGACAAVSASKPRVAVEKLVDSKSPSKPAGGRSAELDSNGTQILFGRDFDGLNVFSPRDCDPGRYGCCDKPMVGCGADGCYDPSKNTCCQARGTTCRLGKECVPEGGCCTTGYKGCGAEGCYNPKTDVCCKERGTTCDVGYECQTGGGCCRTGTKSCGEDKCYNADTSICCTSGSDAWTCTKGEKCCSASKSCYDPDKEACCSGGACSLSGSCCGETCCDSDETCGLDKVCTAKSTSRPTSTTTSSASPSTSGDDASASSSLTGSGTDATAATGDGGNGIGPGARPTGQGGDGATGTEGSGSPTATPSAATSGRLYLAGMHVALLCPVFVAITLLVL
ncbi:MFS phospholipid transporter [Purpureocillium lavendulum]|uniref:MFS phospholipid transporter n=1 Tax=Purpureocillium lavendulum TaxID=1247861 RepID=A0AB34G1Z2_9HYPO|nr:MFS phospholipid transporter [Purpureocillium lavendulum]